MIIAIAASAAALAAPIAGRVTDRVGTPTQCVEGAPGPGWGAGVSAAADAGEKHGLRVAVAVIDTATGGCYAAGDTDGTFGAASVVKVMIAAYLLATKQMTGEATGATAALAYSMITKSDDDAANVLWSRSLAAGLEPWIEAHYHVPNLRSPNDIPGRWGNTHVNALGLAELYVKLKADPTVWHWLSNAMHHTQRIAKDGTDQRFGIPAVVSGAAVKNGWANGSADDPDDGRGMSRSSTATS